MFDFLRRKPKAPVMVFSDEDIEKLRIEHEKVELERKEREKEETIELQRKTEIKNIRAAHEVCGSSTTYHIVPIVLRGYTGYIPGDDIPSTRSFPQARFWAKELSRLVPCEISYGIYTAQGSANMVSAYRGTHEMHLSIKEMKNQEFEIAKHNVKTYWVVYSVDSNEFEHLVTSKRSTEIFSKACQYAKMKSKHREDARVVDETGKTLAIFRNGRE